MQDYPDKKETLDYAHMLTKAGLGLVPIAGGALAELLNFISPPLEKRRANWFNDVANRLKDIETKQEFRFEQIANNDKFIDIFIKASYVAIRTNEEEKLKALKNIVIDSATEVSFDRIQAHLFIDRIDSFTAWHIKILQFIGKEPRIFRRSSEINWDEYLPVVVRTISKLFPEMANQEGLIELVLSDLDAARFQQKKKKTYRHNSDCQLTLSNTVLGNEFLKYIEKE